MSATGTIIPKLKVGLFAGYRSAFIRNRGQSRANIIKFNQQRCYSSHFTYVPDTVSTDAGESVRMNFFQAVNNAMDIALATDPSAGELRVTTMTSQNVKTWLKRLSCVI